MNVWRWVWDREESLRKQGHERLASILLEVAGATLDGRHDRVEAMVEEGLTAARSLDDAWVEVFLRHWRLQSRVFHRHDVRDGLDEAISLATLAAGVARECPQSVCATNDLCVAHGVADGPGFAELRITAADEALARIDASWPCFVCLSKERASALLDARRFDEARAFCEERIRSVPDSAPRASAFHGALADALLALGRADEALVHAQRSHGFGQGAAGTTSAALREALCFARTGRVLAARAKVPHECSLEPAHFVPFARIARELARASALVEDDAWLAVLGRMANVLEARRARREHVQLRRIAAEVACHVGAPALAHRHLAAARADLASLGLRARERARVAEAAELVARTKDAPLSRTESLLRGLRRPRASDLSFLVAMREREPDDPRVAASLGTLLAELGFEAEAEAGLRAAIARRSDDPHAPRALGRILVARGELEHALELARRAPPSCAAELFEIEARVCAQEGRADEAEELFARALTAGAGDVFVRVPYAAVLRRNGRVAEALDVLAPCDPSDREVLWERLLAATLAGDDERASATAVALGVSGHPPRPCFVRRACVPDEAPVLLRAVHEGPVSARIVELGEMHPHVYDDVVLLDPRRPVSTGEWRAHPIFDALAVLAPGDRIVDVLDGVHPGEHGIEALRRVVDELGGELRDETTADDEVVTARYGRILRLYALVAWPRAIDPAAAHAKLRAVVDELARPIVWCSLAERLGDPREIERQRHLLRWFEPLKD